MSVCSALLITIGVFQVEFTNLLSGPQLIVILFICFESATAILNFKRKSESESADQKSLVQASFFFHKCLFYLGHQTLMMVTVMVGHMFFPFSTFKTLSLFMAVFILCFFGTCSLILPSFLVWYEKTNFMLKLQQMCQIKTVSLDQIYQRFEIFVESRVADVIDRFRFYIIVLPWPVLFILVLVGVATKVYSKEVPMPLSGNLKMYSDLNALRN